MNYATIDNHHKILNTGALLNAQPGSVLINFDSHPDLGVPEFPTSKIDIATWIIPKVLDGTFATVVFATLFSHMPTGVFHIAVGTDTQTNNLRIVDYRNTLPTEWKVYWNIDDVDVSNANSYNNNINNMKNMKDVKYATVVAINLYRLNSSNDQLRSELEHEMEQTIHSLSSVLYPPLSNVIISIDLDFFSVRNPMFDEVQRLPKNDQRVFQYLTCIPPEFRNEEIRRYNTSELLTLLANKPCPNYEFHQHGYSIQDMTACELSRTVDKVRRRFPNIPSKLFDILIQSAGQPHHVTQQEERQHTIYPLFQSFLQQCEHHGIISFVDTPVVIAKSSMYTPTVDQILHDIESILNTFV